MPQYFRRAVAAATILVLPAVLVLAGTLPAEAATQTSSCVDGGGVRWTARAVWGATYINTLGVRRTTVDDVGWTTQGKTVKTDSRVQTYDGTGALIQTLTWSGSFDYRSGQAYRSQNPRNPPTAGTPRIKVTLGVDGDGYGDCTVTFAQPVQTPTPTPSPTPTSGSDRYEADVTTATNAERTSRSLTALTTESCVDQFAETQAAKMAAERRIYHQDLGPILTKCGLNNVGENVAYGYPSGAAVTAGWMGSEGHRANLLNPKFRLLGVGAAQASDGSWYAAQVFGARG